MIKDITKLGRDLSKTIIIDDTPELFRGSIKNGIKVETWRGNPLDEVLSLLLPMLLGLVNQHP
jgi:TFIIF-interacting CTD phosphatase-like protein